MKIFITIPWFTPAYKGGGPVQSVLNLVTDLREDMEYYIFCGDRDLDGTMLDVPARNAWATFSPHVQVYYAEKGKQSQQLIDEVDRIKPACLYIIGMFSWHFNIVPVFFCKHVPRIWSIRGMLHPGALSQKSTKKKFFLRAVRASGLHRKLSFHATDAREAHFARTVFGDHIKVHIASNFPRLFERLPLPAKQPGELSIATVALISPMKNHGIVLQALAGITTPVHYIIAGPVKDPVYWDWCQDLIHGLPPHIHVEYRDNVSPAQVEEILGSVHAVVMPSKSENYGHSIIEALSAGRPVITSHFTPWNDLEKRNAGFNADITVAAVRKAIMRLSDMDADTLQVWSRAAAVYAHHHVHLPSLRKAYIDMFKQEAHDA
jgi:glycosyltransferase involved in cell wall biosynthesis